MLRSYSEQEYSSILIPPMSPILQLTGLSIGIGDKEVIHNLSLTVNPGELHAVMGPNGSGKSTLVSTLMGHPSYTVTGGSAEFLGENLLTLQPHERAQKGLFLAFQYPREIAGVTLRNFLFAAYNAQMAARDPAKKKVSPVKFKAHLAALMKELHMDPAFADRSLNKGFSGGEKKKAEVLQMKLLEPRLALLDETDSGLDIDALKTVAQGVQSMRSPEFSAIVVTHYARLLHHLQPDYVHVMVGGNIVQSGAAELALELEKTGYKEYENS